LSQTLENLSLKLGELRPILIPDLGRIEASDLPYEITYLPHDTGESARFILSQSGRPVVDLPTPEGWKAELTRVVGYVLIWFTCLQAVAHPSTNRGYRKATTLFRHDGQTDTRTVSDADSYRHVRCLNVRVVMACSLRASSN